MQPTDETPLAASDGEPIIVGIHGVGSPAVGEVARAIAQGFAASAYPSTGTVTAPSIVVLNQPSSGQGTKYFGIHMHGARKEHRMIWEVNWSDLKGFPDNALGTALYAIKALIAMIQISHRGWNDTWGISGSYLHGAHIQTVHLCFCPIHAISISYDCMRICGSKRAFYCPYHFGICNDHLDDPVFLEDS